MPPTDESDSAPTNSDDRIGSELDLDTFALPPAVGRGLATLYGREAPFETAAEWVTTMRTTLDRREGRAPTIEDLCTAEDGDHAFVGEETSRYVCVLDPLVVPFLTDTPGTIRSKPQVGDETIEIIVTADGIETTHPDAVVSLGVAADVDAGGEPTREDVYRNVCPYIHVFADEAAYEEWADGTDAMIASVPVATGVALARELAENLFGGERAA